MKYPKILCVLSIFIFMGIGVTGTKHVVAEEEWSAGFEAFKSSANPEYHQRHNGNIEWHLFHDSEEPKADKPNYTDIYWIEGGDDAWHQRIMDVEGTSRVSHLTPANVPGSKYHSPCPLCGDSTYFWMNTGDLDDNDTQARIKGDFPGWTKADGVCLNCFECYQLRAGKFYEGSAASSTDEYVIGYNKSAAIQDYFANVK